MKFRTILLGLVFLAASAFAADIDGKWTGTLNTPNGENPVNFTFKADGAKLTGSMTGPTGADVQIDDGKIDGANVSFSVTLDFGGMKIVLNYTGVAAKDKIDFKMEVFGMPLEFVVKKAA